MESKLWCKTAARLDSVVDDMLSTMPNRKDVAAALKEKWAAELAINFDSQRKPIEENIARAKKGQADTVKRLDAMTDPDLIRREEGKYTAFKHDIARYEAQLADINRLEADRDKTTDFMRKWFEVTANYAVLSREDRRLVLEAVAESVEARVYGNDLEITLILRGGKPIKRTIGLKYSGWTAAEQDLLLELSKKGASPLMLCAALPDRTWRSIILKHRGLTGSCLSKSNSPLDLSETFWDRYGNRVQVIEDTPLPDGFDWKKLGDGSVRLVDLSKEGGFEDGIFDNYSISDR